MPQNDDDGAVSVMTARYIRVAVYRVNIAMQTCYLNYQTFTPLLILCRLLLLPFGYTHAISSALFVYFQFIIKLNGETVQYIKEIYQMAFIHQNKIKTKTKKDTNHIEKKKRRKKIT